MTTDLSPLVGVLQQRIAKRAYLIVSAFLYIVQISVYILVKFEPLNIYSRKLFPKNIWIILWAIVAILLILGALREHFGVARLALIMASTVAGGWSAGYIISFLYLHKTSAIVPGVAWGFITATHIIFLHIPDSYFISTITKQLDAAITPPEEE